jgi:hypothetical protein
LTSKKIGLNLSAIINKSENFGVLKIPEGIFKTPDQVQGQGVPQIESAAYTPVREYFNSRDNAAIGPAMVL